MTTMPRWFARAAYWLSVPLLCLLVYWPGLTAWFQADDFAWLSLRRDIAEGKPLMEALFGPMAQGTIRPLSERGFFLVFQQLFGLDSVPWRVFVFLFACACIVLLISIARRMTGSAPGGLAAGAWWTVSIGLAIPMAWTSDFNQILCAFFLLAAFHARLRGAWWTEFAMFVLGFGAMEINVVYPALALAWAIISRERRGLWRIALMFLSSIAYFAWHSHMAPSAASGPYAMHFNGSIFSTLKAYWLLSLGSDVAPVLLLTAGVLAAVLAERRAALMGLTWFFFTLAPLLPLRDHITEYYLTVPVIGLGMVAAGGVKRHRAGLALVALYVVIAAPVSYRACKWYADRSQRARTLVLGTVAAREKNPGKAILLDGLDEQLFDIAIAHPAFHALYLTGAYLSPGTAERLNPPGFLDSVRNYVLPEGPTLHGLAEGKLAVYRMDGDRLRNITTAYQAYANEKLLDKTPDRVDIGNPLMRYLLGFGWYGLETDHRWMPHEASLRIGGLFRSGSHLTLKGWCPEEQWRNGPLKLMVAVDGKWLLPAEIAKPEVAFTRIFPIPAEILGRETVTIHVRVDRTVRVGSEARDVGLAFGLFEVRQD